MNNDLQSWDDLLTFAYKSFHFQLQPSKKTKQRTLASIVKANITAFEIVSPENMNLRTADLKTRVDAKVNDFDLRGAVRLLCSEDSFAPMNDETLDILKAKHPSPSRELHFPSPPDSEECLEVTEIDVKNSIMFFNSGSASGLDGFRPQFFKDLISISAANSGKEVLSTLTELTNFILKGKVNEEICKYIYGASLCALTKKDGGIRPIRRLVSKLACRHVNKEIGEYLCPIQLGFGTKQGCEAAVHATITFLTISLGSNKVFFKIDFWNAFNSIERDKMLQVKDKIPSLCQYIWQSYKNSSLIFYGENIVLSEIGAHQGDPTGPLLFALTIHPLLKKLKCELNKWYLDDGTLYDQPSTVLEDFKLLIAEAKKLGLEVNPTKCELYFCSEVDNDVVSNFNDVCPGISVVTSENLTLLGAPIFDEGFATVADKIFNKLKLMFARLKQLNSHTSYCLLKNCFGIPKLTYLIRTSPAWKFKNFSNHFDNEIKGTLESILNVRLSMQQWYRHT